MTSRVVKTLVTTLVIVVFWTVGMALFAFLTSWMPTWLMLTAAVGVVATLVWHSYRPKEAPDQEKIP